MTAELSSAMGLSSSWSAANAVQARGTLAGEAVGEIASRGVANASAPLPHQDQIARSFGPHDVSGIRAEVGGPAAEASQAIGAHAYATGDRVAFRESPDLHTAAHEAAHVVQQRAGVQLKGGVGQAGDAYERHADAVADRVCAGESAADLLSAGAGVSSSGVSGSQGVQRKEEGATAAGALAQVREMLDKLVVSESEVINLLATLSGPERHVVLTDAWYRQRMVKAFNFAEMSRALMILKPPLATSLEWLEAAAIGSISYYEVKPFILAAPLADRRALTDKRWQSFFTKVCTNDDIVEAVMDLGLPLDVQLTWIEAEVGSVQASVSWSMLAPLVAKAPQNQRDALKTPRWRSFFMSVCNNSTIVDAVRGLNFDPMTRVEWILEEGNAGGLWGGGIDARQIYEALRDQLKGEALTFVELAALNQWNDADRKRIRQIMDGQRNDRPEFQDGLGEAAKQQAGAAHELIARFTTKEIRGKGNVVEVLNVEKLGIELSRLLSSNPALVRGVLDTLSARPGDHDDDAALHALQALPDDALVRIARESSGRDLLLTMVQTLFKGVNLADEEREQKRVMNAVVEVDGANRQGATREVEVISFLYGGKALDAGGAILGGFRGHTLLSVGGLVYSFEAGWSCGRTKAEYLAANTYRDGIGQILKVSEADAEILQENLNRSCGSGVYLVGGDICTGKASQALEAALKGQLHQAQNPQLFIGHLEAAGIVTGRRFYPKTADSPPAH